MRGHQKIGGKVQNKITKDENYWNDYDGLQDAKHQLLSHYLNAWFPILASWSGRALYIDCHAGRGKHKTGHIGSPILALEVLQNHRLNNRILENTSVGFVFIENNEDNFSILQDEILKLGELPRGL